jgi:hypothetical protein
MVGLRSEGGRIKACKQACTAHAARCCESLPPLPDYVHQLELPSLPWSSTKNRWRAPGLWHHAAGSLGRACQHLSHLIWRLRGTAGTLTARSWCAAGSGDPGRQGGREQHGGPHLHHGGAPGGRKHLCQPYQGELCGSALPATCHLPRTCTHRACSSHLPVFGRLLPACLLACLSAGWQPCCEAGATVHSRPARNCDAAPQSQQ